MKQNQTPTGKAKMIIIVSALLMMAVYFGLALLVRELTDWSFDMIIILMSPLLLVGTVVILTSLQKSRFKDDLDKFEKTEAAQAERSMGKDEKPSLWGILLVTFLTILSASLYTFEILRDMDPDRPISEYMPEISCALTLIACAIPVVIIAFNIWKGRVFTSANVNLIYAISSIIFVSPLLQGRFLGETPMLPNDFMIMIYMFISMILFFVGEILEVAVKVRKDQDLII